MASTIKCQNHSRKESERTAREPEESCRVVFSGAKRDDETGKTNGFSSERESVVRQQLIGKGEEQNPNAFACQPGLKSSE